MTLLVCACLARRFQMYFYRLEALKKVIFIFKGLGRATLILGLLSFFILLSSRLRWIPTATHYS